MKIIIILFTLSFSLITSGCYSSSTKEPSAESEDQSAPVTRPVSTRY